jgi:hypothetical protein
MFRKRTRRLLLGSVSMAIVFTIPSFSQNGPGTIDINQTLSDGAQRNTIAFDALGFLTGGLGADSFFPPGKVADFWGFQYLRDNDPTEMGHNTDFLTRAANNMLFVLTSGQRDELAALAISQVDSINQYAMDRFILMKAFRRLLSVDVPQGKPALAKAEVEDVSAELYLLDGRITLQRANVMGGILKSLTAGQRAYLDGLVGRGMLTWPNLPDQLDKRNYTHDVHVAIMTYAGDLFSWYAGSVDADVYFCPERQGTYFGSFYLKDAPAVGNPDYSIDTNLTGSMGERFLQTLTPSQSLLITGLVEIQKPDLLEIVDVRGMISRELRRSIAGQPVDSIYVRDLMDRYGRLDGEIVYNYATNFARVGKTLSSAQSNLLMAARREMIGDLAPQGAYLYADPISIPVIPNTDFLFAASVKTIGKKR